MSEGRGVLPPYLYRLCVGDPSMRLSRAYCLVYTMQYRSCKPVCPGNVKSRSPRKESSEVYGGYCLSSMNGPRRPVGATKGVKQGPLVASAQKPAW